MTDRDYSIIDENTAGSAKDYYNKTAADQSSPSGGQYFKQEPVTMTQKLYNLLAKKAVMIDYLQMKVNEQDWHGVADAAMDLRELEVAIKYEQGTNS